MALSSVPSDPIAEVTLEVDHIFVDYVYEEETLQYRIIWLVDYEGEGVMTCRGYILMPSYHSDPIKEGRHYVYRYRTALSRDRTHYKVKAVSCTIVSSNQDVEKHLFKRGEPQLFRGKAK
jgi:hypothetical protein